jgi:hypothetical protein
VSVIVLNLLQLELSILKLRRFNDVVLLAHAYIFKESTLYLCNCFYP